MKLQNRNLLLLAVVVLAGFMFIHLGHAQQLTIISPADGTVVNPGQTISISVSTSSQAWVFTSGGLPSVSPDVSPNTFLLTIPENTTPGSYDLTAVDSTTDESYRISISVKRADNPTSINILGPSIRFGAIGDKIPLDVYGYFVNGDKVDISSSTDIKYSVTNTAVASVDSEGLVTAIGPGGTTVTASYAGLSSSIPVVVPLGNATPVYKITATPTGTISKDVAGNYTINVNITNNSNATLALLTLASATLNNKNSTWLPSSFTVFDPGISQSIGLTFPAAAGISGTTAVLQIKGTYEGLPKNGQSGDKGTLSFSFRVRLP